MSFEELTDQAIRRVAEIDRKLESGGFQTEHLQPDNSKAERYDSLKKLGHVLPNASLTKVLGFVRAEEGKIKRAKGRLSGAELKKLKSQAMKNIVEQTENIKKRKMENILNELDKLEREYSDRKVKYANQRLADLMQGELSTKYMNEGEALTRIAAMSSNREYDEIELLSLGSVSELAYKNAKKLMKEVPPAVATPEGKKLTAQLEQLMTEQVGTMTYEIKDEKEGRTVRSRISVIDFFNDTVQPKAADFQPEPAASATA